MRCAVRNCEDPACFARSCWRMYGRRRWFDAHPWTMGAALIGVAGYLLWAMQRSPNLKRIVGLP